jgi:hypothetical protein
LTAVTETSRERQIPTYKNVVEFVENYLSGGTDLLAAALSPVGRYDALPGGPRFRHHMA